MKSIFLFFLLISFLIANNNFYSNEFIKYSNCVIPKWCKYNPKNYKNYYCEVGKSFKNNTTKEKYLSAVDNSNKKILKKIYKNLSRIETHFAEELKSYQNYSELFNKIRRSLYLKYFYNDNVIDIKYNKYEIKVLTIINQKQLRKFIFNEIINSKYYFTQYQKMIIKDLVERYI